MSWVEKWAGKNKAKSSCFRQHIYPPENKFELNFVLEAADLRVAIQDSPSDRNSIYTNSGNTRRHRSISFSLAKVVGKQGSRICLRHLGTDDRNDIWLMIDSDMIRPYPSGLELSVPFGFMNSHSVWNKLIIRVDKEEKMAPKEWFPTHPKDPGINLFKVGEKLEAVDRRNAQLICPATIEKINNNFVLVSFDGWSGTFDYWASYNSQDLFPVGWCSKAKHKLQQPGPYYEIVGKPNLEYNIEYSAPSQTQKSLKRKQTFVPISRISKSVKKSINKPVHKSKKKAPTVNKDYDSDGTHICDSDDDLKTKKRKISNYEFVSKGTKSDLESKSNTFRNLFRMWTEKTALSAEKEEFKDKKEDGYQAGKDDDDNNKESFLTPFTKEDSSDNGTLLVCKGGSSDKLCDTNNEEVTLKTSDLSPVPLFVQLTSPKPASPSVVNSSVANSIIEDYKCLSDTSGTSYCAKLDEISSLIMNQTDISKRGFSHLNLPSDPYQWTIDDVQQYLITKNPSLESIAQEFKNHEIDGQALLLLTMNTLRQYMKIKLGPAIKVEHIIKDLLEGKF